MNVKPKRFRKFYALFVAPILVAGGVAASIANGPDRELRFLRETHSQTQLPVLSGAMQDPTFWPHWFYSLDKVTVISASGAETPAVGPLAAGAQLKLYFDDHKSPWSHMELTAQLLESSPRKLSLRITGDSKGKIPRLFNQLDWTVELEPEVDPRSGAQGTFIRGKALARTIHWKSRLFGTVTEKILMNQVFYPNLMELAALRSLTSPQAPKRSSLSSSDALISFPKGN